MLTHNRLDRATKGLREKAQRLWVLLFVAQSLCLPVGSDAAPWTGIIAVAGAAVAYAEVRFRRGPWTSGPRARLLQPADRYARATVAGMAAAATVALLGSVHGVAAAGVILMGTALIASAAAMERARPAPR